MGCFIQNLITRMDLEHNKIALNNIVQSIMRAFGIQPMPYADGASEIVRLEYPELLK